jgi:hypothetical protein
MKDRIPGPITDDILMAELAAIDARIAAGKKRGERVSASDALAQRMDAIRAFELRLSGR